MSLQNPFSDAEQSNPYVSPTLEPSSSGNPLFVPALILLVLAIPWTLYVIAGLAVVFAPTGVFQGMDPAIRAGSLAFYCTTILTNIVFIAGAIAMLRLRPKWLAWTGCVLALVPVFGPCFGITIPLGIWCLVLLLRPDIDARFIS